MRHTRAVIAVTGVALAAGGTAFASAQSGAPGPLDDLGVLKTRPAAALTSAERHQLTAEEVRSYGLDLGEARVATDDRWIVVPGADGICLIPGDRSMTCGPIEA